MENFQLLMDALFWEKVERAKRLSPTERMADMFELAEMAYGNEDPELARRVAIVREMENRLYYGPPQPRL